jgi:hypothetical protein
MNIELSEALLYFAENQVIEEGEVYDMHFWNT